MPSLGEQEGLEEMMARMGQGGVKRGPGTAPITFGEEQNLKTKNIENVNSRDYKRAAPGEVLAIGETKHDDENKPSNRQAGGTLSREAGGGDAVWRESLMPEEKALLKRYFK